MRKLAVLSIATLLVTGLVCGSAIAREYKIGYVDMAKV